MYRPLEKGMVSLQVTQIIIEHHPKIKEVRMISHEVSVNWRQRYKQGQEKLGHIDEGLVHTIPTINHWYEREEFCSLHRDTMPKIEEFQVWSFNSKVRCHDGIPRHVPMMNFHPEEGIAQEQICVAIEHICPEKSGVLLESGRYYHYYGNFLLSEAEWLRFLDAFLMPCVLVSPRYVGHALVDGYCSLRLTADATYKPTVPRVIEVFH